MAALEFVKGITSPFFIVNYLSSSKAEVSKFPLYCDIHKKYDKLQKIIKRHIKEVSIERGNCM